MDRFRVALLVGLISVFAIVGGVAAVFHRRIVPSGPIELENGSLNTTKPRIEAIEISCLASTDLYPFVECPSEDDETAFVQSISPLWGTCLNLTPRTELRQGKLVWIVLNYTFRWKGLPFPLYGSQTGQGIHYDGSDLGDHILRGSEVIFFNSTAAASLQTAIDLLDSQGVPVPGFLGPSDEEVLRPCGGSEGPFGPAPVDEWKLVVCGGWLPVEWTAGNYTLRARAWALATGVEDSKEVRIEIMPGSPPRPAPIERGLRKLMVQPEELPGNWTVEEEYSGTLIMESIDELRRLYKGEVDGVERGVHITMYQFVDVPSAKHSFDRWRKMMVDDLKNWRRNAGFYGYELLDNISDLDLGDEAFLLDKPLQEYWLEMPDWPPGISKPEWDSGSVAVLLKDNLVIHLYVHYNVEAAKQGRYMTASELIEVAELQKDKIRP